MSIYGILISLAILICALIAEKKVLHDKRDINFFWNLVLISILTGIVGARVYHVVDLWEYYSQNLSKIFYFWNGGLGIWGGITAAFIAIVLCTKSAKENSIYWLDLLSSVMPLGQAIGRWGNYFNQENFGKVTNLPWGISIDKFPNQKFHPLFLYESILDLLLFFILRKFKAGSGNIIFYYLIGYSIIRFLLEFIKMDPWIINGINVAQAFCAAVIAVTLGYVIYIIRPRRI